MPHTSSILLGSLSPGAFLAFFFLALLGQAVVLGIDSSGRDPKTAYSPEQFSFKYLLIDNWKRIALGVLTIALSIRFYPDIARAIPKIGEIFGVELNGLVAVMIGALQDVILMFLKKVRRAAREYAGAGNTVAAAALPARNVAWFLRASSDRAVVLGDESFFPPVTLDELRKKPNYQVTSDSVGPVIYGSIPATIDGTGRILAAEGNEYETAAVDFVGGRPPHRPS